VRTLKDKTNKQTTKTNEHNHLFKIKTTTRHALSFFSMVLGGFIEFHNPTHPNPQHSLAQQRKHNINSKTK